MGFVGNAIVLVVVAGQQTSFDHHVFDLDSFRLLPEDLVVLFCFPLTQVSPEVSNLEVAFGSVVVAAADDENYVVEEEGEEALMIVAEMIAVEVTQHEYSDLYPQSTPNI